MKERIIKAVVVCVAASIGTLVGDFTHDMMRKIREKKNEPTEMKITVKEVEG